MSHREFKAVALSMGIHLMLLVLYVYWTYPVDDVKEIKPKMQKIALGNLDVKSLQNLSSSLTPSEASQSNTQEPAKETLTQSKEAKSSSSQTSKKHPSKKPQQSQSAQPAVPVPSFYSLMEQKLEDELKMLYGQDFYTLTQEDKDYLDENYRKIYAITQRNLKYPREAGKLRLQGNNRIEFYLQPNGDITGLKIIRPSGYALFDKNSLHTIEVSYKDYPRPKKPLKIIFHIYYKIHP